MAKYWLLRHARQRGRDFLLLFRRGGADVQHVDLDLRLLRGGRVGRLLLSPQGQREKAGPKDESCVSVHAGILTESG